MYKKETLSVLSACLLCLVMKHIFLIYYNIFHKSLLKYPRISFTPIKRHTFVNKITDRLRLAFWKLPYWGFVKWSRLNGGSSVIRRAWDVGLDYIHTSFPWVMCVCIVLLMLERIWNVFHEFIQVIRPFLMTLNDRFFNVCYYGY